MKITRLSNGRPHFEYHRAPKDPLTPQLVTYDVRVRAGKHESAFLGQTSSSSAFTTTGRWCVGESSFPTIHDAAMFLLSGRGDLE